MKQSPFRSIRQKLFNEGKLLRYLGYAVGEIALIIVGILMALKINDWNEDRKAQVEFDAYVVQLREDVRLAIENARKNSEQMKRQANGGNLILTFLYKKDYSQDELKAFNYGLEKINIFGVPQIRIGLLGKLMDGDTEIISQSRPLALEALKLESNLDRSLMILEGMLGSLRFKAALNDEYVARSNSLFPEIELRYDLDHLKGSTAFSYYIQNLILSYANFSTFADQIAEDLESFLTVLKEYE